MKLAPPRVDDITRYWTELPKEPSPRLTYWVQRIREGWRPNRRIRTLGYDGAASCYGVYIAEYLKVISPLLDELEAATPKVEQLIRGRQESWGPQDIRLPIGWRDRADCEAFAKAWRAAGEPSIFSEEFKRTPWPPTTIVTDAKEIVVEEDGPEGKVQRAMTDEERKKVHIQVCVTPCSGERR